MANDPLAVEIVEDLAVTKARIRAVSEYVSKRGFTKRNGDPNPMLVHEMAWRAKILELESRILTQLGWGGAPAPGDPHAESKGAIRDLMQKLREGGASWPNDAPDAGAGGKRL